MAYVLGYKIAKQQVKSAIKMLVFHKCLFGSNTSFLFFFPQGNKRSVVKSGAKEVGLVLAVILEAEYRRHE